MIRNKNGDSMVWIVVWIFILWFTLIWVMNILNFSHNTWWRYEDEIYMFVNESNADNILKNIDTSIIWYDEDFYIYKDNINKEFKIFTGSSNLQYSFIDKLWNLSDPLVNIWKTFKRIFYNKVDVLKHIISPSDISNIVFWFDANNINWNYNSWMVDLEQIWTWVDLSGNSNTWSQSNATYKPRLLINWINGNDMVEFSWSVILEIADAPEINYDTWASTYSNKSFALVFKSWFDLVNPQVLYEQWWETSWYNIMIHSNNIYAWIWNDTRDVWNKYKSVNLWEVIPDSVYFIVIVQDSSNWLDVDNKFTIYMNGVLISEQDHVDPQDENADNIWIWWVNEKSKRPSDEVVSTWSPYIEYFSWWWIWEFISWNHALSENEIRWMQNYFNDKWLNWNSNVIFDTVKYSITKYNN